MEEPEKIRAIRNEKASSFPMHPAIPMANAWCRFNRLGLIVKRGFSFQVACERPLLKQDA